MVFRASFEADELFECVWPFCGIGASGVKLALGLTELSLHSRLIADLHRYLCQQQKIILSGFKAAEITEVVESASHDVLKTHGLIFCISKENIEGRKKNE